MDAATEAAVLIIIAAGYVSAILVALGVLSIAIGIRKGWITRTTLFGPLPRDEENDMPADF